MQIRVDHVKLPVADLERTKAFYAAALAPLGYELVFDGPESIGFGNADREPIAFLRTAKPSSGTHIALTAANNAAVDAFHAAALAAGGRDNGAPGPRPYGGEYYAAFVLDPDGHNIEVVRHGEREQVSVDRSTSWPYKDGEPGEFVYQRYGHPAGVEAERKLGGLDGGHALLFASGSGATTALVLTFLSSGDTIALAEGAYYGTGVLFRELERWGLRVVEFDQTGQPPDGVELVWLEAPSNPFLTMPDLEAAAAHPARVVVDATASTPIHLRPLEHGADFVLHSATKYLGGHDDILLGAVVCKREDDAERLKEFRTRSGIVAAPDPCALLLRGLETLEPRVRRQTESAIELTKRLETHPAVQTVRYPGLGGLLSFDVAGADEARHVETSLRLITNATSLGGVNSLLEARARWEGDRVPPGLLRLSVGLEPVEELWADLFEALESLPTRA